MDALDFFTDATGLLQNVIRLGTSTAQGASSVLNNGIQAQTSSNNAALQSQTAIALNGANYQNAATLQKNNQDFMAAENSSSQANARLMQSRSLANASALQGNNFQFLQQQQSSNQEFLKNQQQQNQQFMLKNQAAGAGMNFGGSLISGGLNYLYAKSLMNNQAELQRENFDYTTGKAATALQANGLPSWLAYMPGSASNFPKTSQAMNGSNYLNSQLPGNTSQLLWTGSASQLAFGVGDAPMGS